MSYLLDTNVLSELIKPRPEPAVHAWISGLNDRQAFLSCVSIAELRRGIEVMDSGKARDRLESWVARDLVPRFRDRVLPLDLAAADAWGRLMARSKAVGANLGILDGFLAATAVTRGLTLVTRNTRHFEWSDVPLLNPWMDA